MLVCPSCRHRNYESAKFCEEYNFSFAVESVRDEGSARRDVPLLRRRPARPRSTGYPERLRALRARYFERMKAILERHGGSVEKFIGDAVMAVFRVPALHEDEALRAVRSTVEMRDALPELDWRGGSAS